MSENNLKNSLSYKRYENLRSKKGYITPAQAASILKVTVITVRRLIRDGRLEAKNVSMGEKRPTYLIKEDEVYDFVKQTVR